MSTKEEKLFDYQEFGHVERKDISIESDILSKTAVQALKAIEESAAN